MNSTKVGFKIEVNSNSHRRDKSFDGRPCLLTMSSKKHVFIFDAVKLWGEDFFKKHVLTLFRCGI